MRLNKRLTPYPVLSAFDDDYVRGSFRADITEELSFDYITLTIDYALDDEGLQELLHQKKACFVTHVECSVTGYRRAIRSFEQHNVEPLDAADFADEIEVSTYIVATENIHGYSNKQFNLSFGKNASFDIWSGGILAIGPEYTIDINRDGKSYDKMADILAIAVDENNLGYAWVNTDSDCLKIYVSREVLNAYHRHKATERYTIIQSIFVPAMMSVLLQMTNPDNFLKSYRWYRVLEKLLSTYGIELDDISLEASNAKNAIGCLAQEIFKNPLQKAMAELDKLDAEEDEPV